MNATAAAVTVGSFVAAGFLIFGLMSGHFGLVAVAIVVYLLGQAELAQVRATRPREFGRVNEWFESRRLRAAGRAVHRDGVGRGSRRLGSVREWECDSGD